MTCAHCGLSHRSADCQREAGRTVNGRLTRSGCNPASVPRGQRAGARMRWSRWRIERALRVEGKP